MILDNGQEPETVIVIKAGGIPSIVKEISLFDIEMAAKSLQAFVDEQKRRAMVTPPQDAAIPTGQAAQESQE